MDVEESQQKTITLLIKTPNQAQEDQTVDGVCLNWTVKELKTHLSIVYTTKPAVSDQRLIYAGKLLPDHLQIKDLFRQTDCIPTLHLVCAFRNPPQGPLGARPKTKGTEQPHPSSPRTMAPSPSPSPSSSPSTVQTPSTPELRQRRQTSSTSAAAPAHTHTPVSPPGTPSWPAAAVPGALQMTQPAFPTYSLYSPEQLLWLQHVYARQYYMQYHAALAAAGTVPSAPATTIGQYPPVPAHQVPVPAALANQPANQNPAQDGAFINPGEANQNMRMNAQGGPVMEDEEDVERDWLDWLYSAARFGVLLMIVYFNSNLTRFLLVMSTLLLMYLHTAGWFPFRRRLQVQGLNHVLNPEIQHNQQNENRNPNPNPADELADRQREEAAAAADGSDGQGPMTAVLVPPHRVSAMWTAWVFFKTFFSSLIPEVPQGVAN
ncbi:homocysteine-responsive endoplasmic reticulum-resident ubiquitin-like domain member 1 protein [Siniperca chuatsi]|uniref:homocysteine-responsive endoplasmic reticulum-resident ubiquitin-like domain member 1 protein n=1 Tax=Siniperca chuatsi TaxID=119488 RepID=UPI001CE08CDF|nr:homocysteine-responsive endoplasmic reticulum-resident ubiquitin-like domain member 1 protein [Siniperca chuatsi]